MLYCVRAAQVPIRSSQTAHTHAYGDLAAATYLRARAHDAKTSARTSLACSLHACGHENEEGGLARSGTEPLEQRNEAQGSGSRSTVMIEAHARDDVVSSSLEFEERSSMRRHHNTSQLCNRGVF